MERQQMSYWEPLTRYQTVVLEEEFQSNSQLNELKLNEVAGKVGLPKAIVQVWFEEKRIKEEQWLAEHRNIASGEHCGKGIIEQSTRESSIKSDTSSVYTANKGCTEKEMVRAGVTSSVNMANRGCTEKDIAGAPLQYIVKGANKRCIDEEIATDGASKAYIQCNEKSSTNRGYREEESTGACEAHTQHNTSNRCREGQPNPLADEFNEDLRKRPLLHSLIESFMHSSHLPPAITKRKNMPSIYQQSITENVRPAFETYPIPSANSHASTAFRFKAPSQSEQSTYPRILYQNNTANDSADFNHNWTSTSSSKDSAGILRINERPGVIFEGNSSGIKRAITRHRIGHLPSDDPVFGNESSQALSTQKK